MKRIRQELTEIRNLIQVAIVLLREISGKLR